MPFDLQRRSRRPDDDESYFVSLTDLMAGVLFLFIIMLTYFGLELQKSADAVAGRNTPVDHLKLDAPRPPPKPGPPAPAGGTDVRDPRLDLMQRIEDLLAGQNPPVEIDEQAGVLRFPDRAMFDAAGAPTPQGRAALAATARALRRVLPCYSFAAALPRPDDCPPGQGRDGAGRVGALLVEGHADGPDAWGLSLREAGAAFAALAAAEPALPTLASRPDGGQPILTVGGYGASRPLGDDATRNARLELRIVMATPD